MKRWAVLLTGLLAAGAATGQQPVDNCASLLGSLGVELRHVRAQPGDARPSFSCPRETGALLGAERQRVLNALGTPDATTHVPGSGGRQDWSYFFSSAPAGERGPGIAELVFSFDGDGKVSAVSCQRTR